MNNALTVVGYVSQPPKIKRFASGKQCVEFSVAVKEWELDEHGNNLTLFLDVKAFNGVAERVLKTITKGREVVLNGRLGVEAFTSAQGKEISKPIIKLVSFHLCGKKPEGAVPQAEVKQLAAAQN